MDETMLEPGETKCKVITHKELSQPYKEKPPKFEHISLVLAISASGGFTRPLCIFPLKTLPPLTPETEKFYAISGQENGFITNEIFHGWIRAVFIPHVNNIRQINRCPHQKALLLVDPHSTQDFAPALGECEEHNILVLTFPAHSSTILQPLDLEVNMELKRVLGNHFKPIKDELKEDRRIRLLDASVHALQIALAGLYIKSSFARAGIWPYSKEAPLNSHLVRDPLNEPVTNKPNKKRRGHQIAGRILTQEIDVTPQISLLKPPCSSFPSLTSCNNQEQSIVVVHNHNVN